MVYNDDTLLTPEILDKLLDPMPEGSFVGKRGLQLPPPCDDTWLVVCNDLSFGVETPKDLVRLGNNLLTLGNLRRLCWALNIPLRNLI